MLEGRGVGFPHSDRALKGKDCDLRILNLIISTVIITIIKQIKILTDTEGQKCTLRISLMEKILKKQGHVNFFQLKKN